LVGYVQHRVITLVVVALRTAAGPQANTPQYTP
jgi:hypothetical protein